MAETRKLAAILAADVVGYSKLAGSDEERTLARLRALRSDLIDPTVAVHNGCVVKRTGDGKRYATLTGVTTTTVGQLRKQQLSLADNPTWVAYNERLFEGLRKAGMPEE
jgi:class 3 adenylate cyclase